MTYDIRVRNEGTIFLFTPVTKRGLAWINDNVGDDAQYWGQALVVEHRYARTVASGMQSDGLVLA